MTDGEFQKAVLERFEAMDAQFDALPREGRPRASPGSIKPSPPGLEVSSPHALAQGGRTVRPQPVWEAWSTGAEVAGAPLADARSTRVLTSPSHDHYSPAP